MAAKKKEKMELPKPIIKKKKKSKTQKPPAVDKLMIPAIIAGVALLGYQFMNGLQSEIPRINVQDDVELREVFFGAVSSTENVTTTHNATNSTNVSEKKKAYAVLCHKELDVDNVATNIPVSSVFQDAYNDGSAPAEFRLLDCDYVLPDSGKTIAERFKLNLKLRPTIFVSGNAVNDGKPKQVPTKHLKTGTMFTKALKSLLESKTVKIETTQDLRSRCLDHDICAILMKGRHSSTSKSTSSTPKYMKDAIQKLIPEYPKVKFVSVDSNNLYMKNLEHLLPVQLDDNNPSSYHRMVVMKKVSGSSKPGKGEEKSSRLITSMVTTDKSLSYGVMSNLLADTITNKATATKLAALPQIKTRTKKLLAEENAKRERKLNQEKAANSPSSGTGAKGGGSTGGFFSGDNDGSREGRKAERDRRRAEHNKENNVKPKTPEEIAEIERQRRIRMAEEAEKWNMAPDDAPPEGDITGEEEEPVDYSTYVEEDVDVEDLDDGGSGDEDDEDFLDLD